MTDEQPEKREEPDEEELERRLKALLGESDEPQSIPEPEEPDDFELKLREIEDKAASIKSSARMPDPPEWDYKRPESRQERQIKSDAGSYRGIGVGLTLAYAMVGPLVAGWGIGYLVDRGSGTNQWQTWGTVIGMFLGFLAVIVLLGRTNRDK